MKFSFAALLALAIVAPTYAAVVARVEGEVQDAPAKHTGMARTWLPVPALVRSHPYPFIASNIQPEVVTCYNTGTKADRALIVSVIDDWCGRVIGTYVPNGQTVWSVCLRETSYDYGTFTVYVSGEAINNCGGFTIDGNCNRLLREPVDQCNTGGVNGKQPSSREDTKPICVDSGAPALDPTGPISEVALRFSGHKVLDNPITFDVLPNTSVDLHLMINPV
ncbi:hypothetical protein DFH06DRAFT_1292655 [Mycena polygramma]|nr:hypothetical protein DFH06DRAFT_1292655 [Mycena polygramma]